MQLVAHSSASAFLALVLLAPLAGQAARVDLHNNDQELVSMGEEVLEKSGSDDHVSIQISFNASMQGHGNDIGRLMVKFPSGPAVLTNQGFAQGQTAWPPGSILGKSDNYVWPIPPQGPTFTFDHGVSDLVLGDVSLAGVSYRPEFDEIVYGKGPGSSFRGYKPLPTTPQQALQKQLLEERKESTLTMGAFRREGYFVPNQGYNAKFRYSPHLRLKTEGQEFQQIGRASSFTMAELVRPSILDIDNLFASKPDVPGSFPPVIEVSRNPLYGGGGRQGYNNGGMRPGRNNGNMQPGYNNGGGMQPGYNNGGMQPGMQPGYNNGGMQPGYNNGGGRQPGYNNGGMQPGYNNGGGRQPGYNNVGGGQPASRCFLDHGVMNTAMNIIGKTCEGRCSTSSECGLLGGRWKAKYCTGGHGCGCCKEIGMHPRYSLAQTEAKAETEVEAEAGSQAESESEAEAQQAPLQVDMRVQWLTPVLQKFRCVSVGDQYAKLGGAPLYIAMGWDTEQGITGLDLDISLVPLDGKKQVIQHKMVYYQAKTPQALSCGHNHYAMRAFGDDRSGGGAGDDELLKLDLACLSQYHPDVEAVAVMVNIFSPQGLTWSNIDSAYLRIISGGQEVSHGGNHFIRNAEAVRSYVRLSGNNLKRDPSLQNNGLAVGMFFRQPRGNWAFAALMKGLPGRNAPQSAPYLMKELRELVYPANQQWDQTREQQSAMATGAFGQDGLLGEATFNGLVQSGQLPCIASRKDQAFLMLGHMTPAALDNVAQNPKIPETVKSLATKIRKGGKAAHFVQQLAKTVDKMEEATTEGERQEIATNIKDGKVEIAPPTAEESQEAEDDLDGLFDELY